MDFFSFAKNMGKSLSNKYSQKHLDSAKKSTADAIKTAEATGDLIGNKIAGKITKPATELHSKELHNSDEIKEEDVEIATPKKKYISPEERKQIFEELRLVPKKYV